MAREPVPLPPPEEVSPYPVVADIDFAEGPIFDQQGNLYFVNYVKDGTIGRRTPDGTVSIWIHTGGQANGTKVDAYGNVIVADFGGKRILRVHPITRAIEVLTGNFQGQPYLGPNDVCLDLAGNIYFTDPHTSSVENPIGCVYRIAADGTVTRLASGLAFPNGLAVHPDQTRFYVAETGYNRIVGWNLKREDGTLSDMRTIFQFPTPTVDGIMFDEYDRLWVARWSNCTVDVVDVDREALLASYSAGGDKVSNLCFYETSLYVTVAGQHSIHRLDVGVRGAKLVP